MMSDSLLGIFSFRLLKCLVNLLQSVSWLAFSLSGIKKKNEWIIFSQILASSNAFHLKSCMDKNSFRFLFLSKKVQISEFLPAGALKSTQSDQSNNSYSRPHNTTTNTMLNHRKISKDGGMSCTTEQQDF